MSNVKELLEVCAELNIECGVLVGGEASEYIGSVVERFNPRKIVGHLAIDFDSVAVPVERCEFSYSVNLQREPVYVFFDQEGEDRGQVVVLGDGRELCRVMEGSFGMEYFVSNKAADYLVAVNWYVVEAAGTAKSWISNFELDEN